MGAVRLEDVRYTYDDYKQWEGDWELIEGVPFAMSPSPMYEHQFINGKIFRQLDEKLDNCSKCKAIFEIDWLIAEDSAVRPDSMVLCYEPEEKLTKKPEIIFEVASKPTVKKDETIKFQIYQQEGVQYYIIVYPDIKKAKVYKLVDYVYRKIGDFSDESYTFEVEGCKIEFDFGFIWRQ